MAHNILAFPVVIAASMASAQGFEPLDWQSLGYVSFGILIGIIAGSSQVYANKDRPPNALRDNFITSGLVALFNAFTAMIIIEYAIDNLGAPRTALTAIGIAMVIGALGPKMMNYVLKKAKAKFEEEQ